MLKNQISDNINQVKNQNKEKKKIIVAQAKLEKGQGSQFIDNLKMEEMNNNKIKKDKIKFQEKLIQQKKEKELEDKILRARLEVESQILEEEKVKLEKESLVSKLEQEEYELIQRLQNTQLRQQEG